MANGGITPKRATQAERHETGMRTRFRVSEILEQVSTNCNTSANPRRFSGPSIRDNVPRSDLLINQRLSLAVSGVTALDVEGGVLVCHHSVFEKTENQLGKNKTSNQQMREPTGYTKAFSIGTSVASSFW